MNDYRKMVSDLTVAASNAQNVYQRQIGALALAQQLLADWEADQKAAHDEQAKLDKELVDKLAKEQAENELTKVGETEIIVEQPQIVDSPVEIVDPPVIG